MTLPSNQTEHSLSFMQMVVSSNCMVEYVEASIHVILWAPWVSDSYILSGILFITQKCSKRKAFEGTMGRLHLVKDCYF